MVAFRLTVGVGVAVGIAVRVAISVKVGMTVVGSLLDAVQAVRLKMIKRASKGLLFIVRSVCQDEFPMILSWLPVCGILIMCDPMEIVDVTKSPIHEQYLIEYQTQIPRLGPPPGQNESPLDFLYEQLSSLGARPGDRDDLN